MEKRSTTFSLQCSVCSTALTTLYQVKHGFCSPQCKLKSLLATRSAKKGDCIIPHTTAISWEKKSFYIPRLAYEMASGKELTRGQRLITSCNFKKCITPSHTKAITEQELLLQRREKIKKAPQRPTEQPLDYDNIMERLSIIMSMLVGKRDIEHLVSSTNTLSKDIISSLRNISDSSVQHTAEFMGHVIKRIDELQRRFDQFEENLEDIKEMKR